MPDLDVFKELLIVLAATLAIVFVFHKLRLSSIVGFLLTGVIIGPHALGLIKSVAQVELLAEIGVVLLLFTIGVEFSLETIFLSARRLLWAGTLQVLLTVAAVAAVARLFGAPLEVGIFYGFLVSLSSTAIVLRIYNERGETHSIQGRLAAGILLLQDLCIIPMALLVPVLGRAAGGSLAEVGRASAVAVAALAVMVLAARRLLPFLLHQVARLRNREIFVLFVVFVCLGTAWLASASGLSLALGALVAGLVISESELSHQVVADVLPLRDCFSGIFFISVGMLLNLGFLTRELAPALVELLLLVAIKTVVVFVVFWRLYRSVRLGIVLGLSLAQVGEFSFILAKAGMAYSLLTPESEQIFLAASILSMMATPFLIQSVHGLAFGLEQALGRAARRPRVEGEAAGDRPEQGHVIVVGYGLNGQNLARVLKEVGIPYTVLEMNPDLVRSARAAGEPIVFGDGTRPEILREVGIERARVVVVAISDPAATARVVSQARRLRPDVYLIVRTRYVAEIEHLYQLGADQVIPEEFETSVEIFARVLQEYHVPRNVISLQVDLIRKEHYGTLRGLRLQGRRLDELSDFLAGTTTDIVSILEGSPAAGRSLGELDLRKRTGALVIAVVRDGKPCEGVGPDFVLAVGDRLVLSGPHQALDDAVRALNPPASG
ncbi:MAG TPA: cation:proton antiporter [candidate division Zixibacteria bacterium]|nr:cation:proton antiporter [candidate division Zixibacteria bacterium]